MDFEKEESITDFDKYFNGNGILDNDIMSNQSPIKKINLQY